MHLMYKKPFSKNIKQTEKRANDEIWTRDLFLTKETLYPWATSAVQVIRKTFWAGDRVYR